MSQQKHLIFKIKTNIIKIVYLERIRLIKLQKYF